MITILQIAKARGVHVDEHGCIDGAEFERVGLPLMGGCYYCHATIAAYNAYPGRNGYWHCADCINDDAGYQTVAEFEEDN